MPGEGDGEVVFLTRDDKIRRDDIELGSRTFATRIRVKASNAQLLLCLLFPP